MSEISYRIAQVQDVDAVYDFEINQQFGDKKDDFENQMSVWTSSFRKESLEHYFKLGWSFVAEDRQGHIKGFFLGQPLLFFDSQTQTLWIEMVSSNQADIRQGLCDLAYRLAREKHFQRVFFSPNNLAEFPETFKNAQPWSRETVWLKTTKSL